MHIKKNNEGFFCFCLLNSQKVNSRSDSIQIIFFPYISVGTFWPHSLLLLWFDWGSPLCLHYWGVFKHLCDGTVLNKLLEGKLFILYNHLNFAFSHNANWKESINFQVEMGRKREIHWSEYFEISKNFCNFRNELENLKISQVSILLKREQDSHLHSSLCLWRHAFSNSSDSDSKEVHCELVGKLRHKLEETQEKFRWKFIFSTVLVSKAVFR